MKIYNYLLVTALSVGALQSAHASAWPTGVADSVTVTTGQRLYIPVLANDRGQGLSLKNVNKITVALGSVQMNSARTAVFYTSKPGFTGNDSFWYAFKDNRGRTNSTQVFLKVVPPRVNNNARANNNSRTNNNARVRRNPGGNNFSGWPVANVDNVKVSKNTSITIPVLNNDVGDRLKLISVNEWSVNGGRASIKNNQVVYRPKPNYAGKDSFWYNFSDARGRKNSTQVMVTITGGSTAARSLSTPRSAPGNTQRKVTNYSGAADAVRIPMHSGFLKNQRFVWGEAGGMQNMKASRAAGAGSVQLQVNNGFALKNNQLITYLSTNGQYYTVATSQSSGNTINLKTALPAPIAQWGDIWNFYDNGAHPNTIGYYSIADFALRKNNISALNSGKHVMLGDSWFSSPGVKERLAQRLPKAQIINMGVGGQTAANLLERFDRQVAPARPNIVWLMAGTNDYYQGVSVASYKATMKKLIEKINAIGAKAMVFDSSVAPSKSGSDVLTETSHQYARAVASLLNR